MPPDVPLWMVGVATAFAVIIGKEAFGGTGMNILNVALLARVFIFFAYPTYISGDEVWIAGLETTDKEGNILPDAYSGATILGFLANFESLTEPMRVYSTTAGEWAGMYAPLDIVFGFIPGSIGETNKIAILIGAIILLASGVGSWRIMVSVFVGAFVTSMLLYAVAVSYTHLTLPTMLCV